MSLRPYQQEFLDAIKAAKRRGVNRQLGVLCTGGGKTIVFSHLPEALEMQPGEKMLVLVHRDELVWQAKEKLQKYNPDLHVDVEKAEFHCDPDADIVVASVQTIGKTKKREDGTRELSPRLLKFDPDVFRYVVVDEGHHAIAPLYSVPLRHLRCYKPEPENNDPNTFLLLVTATPNRADNIGLELICDEIVFPTREKPYGLMEMIDDRWLCPIDAWRIETSCDISEVEVSRGDLQVGSLSRAVNTPERNKLVVDSYLKYSEGQRGLAFTVDVAHAYALAQYFNDAGVPAFAIDAKTPADTRRQLLKDFRNGVYRVGVGCGIFVEGFDDPGVMVIMMTRPTKSGVVYQQSVGRGLRPFPSAEDLDAMWKRGEIPEWIKEKAVILDFVDVSGRHSLITLPTLFGLRPDFDTKGKRINEVIKEMEKVIGQKKLPLSMSEVKSAEELKAIAERVDLFQKPIIPDAAKQHSRFAWTSSGPGSFQLCLPEYTMLRIGENTLGQYEVYKSIKGVRTLQGVHKDLHGAFRAADGMIPRDAQILLTADANWRIQPATDSQIDLLWRIARDLKNGFPSKDSFAIAIRQKYNKGECSQLISERTARR